MEIKVRNLSKSFDGREVFRHFSQTFYSGSIYCIMGASGIGKTTLFRILLGLVPPDTGTVSITEGAVLSAVFQENRLCESFSALDNVRMVLPSGAKSMRESARADLCKLLPEEAALRPVSSLSGGMKRRVAICRALALPFDAVLMDEPFTGLDEDNRKKAIEFVRQKAAGKLAVINTHQEGDVPLLGASLIRFPQN